ncbi:MAG: EAL domain-containing protein [Rhizobiales bacterium]|nr:EAL domain-containing protein [Rhizobacter sp.]
MNAASLTASYNPWVVIVSILIATLASYVTLDLTKRVRTPDRVVARIWWAGGSIAMGSGIWAMHFVGMLAYELPIALGYTKLLTFVSWVAAVGASGAALAIASRSRLGAGRLAGGSIVMGAGICAMHYLGMAAIDVRPGIAWNPWWVAASALIAVGASGAALTIFFLLRRASQHRSSLYQGLAAVLMGLAISGMHYAGMAGAGFAEGSVCLSASSLAGSQLGSLVALGAVVLLAVTLLTSILDARSQGKTTRLTASLKATNAQLKLANAELQKRAFLDPLTQLPNRLLFEDRLGHAVARGSRAEDRIVERAPAGLAVLFIDLDGFKTVNDWLGHAAGDAVLKEAALRLRSVARETDTVARVGGDEFLLLMEDVSGIADCVNLARRLVLALAHPFEMPGQPVLISASIGIVMHPGHGHHDKLIANADTAMYAAKRAGGNTYVVFESRMDGGATEQYNLQQDLRHALERGQMQLHYQPKVDGLRGQISGVEALLRWTHPVQGMVPPGEFIPIAERFGLIGALGAWVIEEACRQMQAWSDEGVRMRVAINISVHQLREEDLVERIRLALERHMVDPSQLLCEITESVAMEDMKATQRAFEGLARIGVFLSIDDFGTGYSSLSYLRQLPARQLKIDRSFINDLESSGDARAVVDAVVRLAHALGLRVVAEGVETEGQRDVLLALGCDELQGYFFARPMAANTLLAWTHGNKPADAVDFTPSVLLDELG